MDRKLVTYCISAFLAVLFLSTIGTMITGYAILPQGDINLKHFPYPFIKYGDYNDLYIVVSDGATLDELETASDIGQILKGTTILTSPKIITASRLPEGEHNIILIGDPCTNKLISYELGTSDCSLGLKQGEGLLVLSNHEKTSTLIISGYDIEGLLKAAKVIENYNTFPLNNDKLIVSGNINNIYSLVLKQLI